MRLVRIHRQAICSLNTAGECRRGSRTARQRCLADSHAIVRDDQELVKVRAEAGQNVIQPRDFCGQLDVLAKTEVDHTSMWLPTDEDEFAEVAVIGNENTALSVGNRQDLPIGEARGVIDGNRGDVMAAGTKAGEKAGVGAFVEEKPHAYAGTRALRLARLRLVSTASWAKASAACTSSIVSRG